MKYLDKCMPIMCFHPWPKFTFFDMRWFMFIENPVGNHIFFMSSFIALLCCFNNNQLRALVSIWSPLLFDQMTFFIAWLDSSMSLQILIILSLSCLPSKIFNNVSITFFPICKGSNKFMIRICS